MKLLIYYGTLMNIYSHKPIWYYVPLWCRIVMVCCTKLLPTDKTAVKIRFILQNQLWSRDESSGTKRNRRRNG